MLNPSIALLNTFVDCSLALFCKLLGFPRVSIAITIKSVMTAILGGGISGLSAAFYGCEKKLGSLVLMEASERLGGWVQSVETRNGSIFEMGPRTVRPTGPSGRNTLDLIDRLNLTDKVIPIHFTHPSARNRMIYVDEKLHLLPNSLTSLFKTVSPFDRPLIKYLMKDLRAKKIPKDDESIYSFAERRFGGDVADYLISAMLCGICAGDAKKISVNFLMPSLFEAEQKHGSITKGLLVDGFNRLFTKNKEKKKEKKVIGSPEMAENEGWAIWGLEGGLEQLPLRLTESLKNSGVEIRLNERCEKMTFRDNHVELEANDKIQQFSRVISTLPAKNLATLLERQHPQLARELSAIPFVTVAVVNLEFPGQCLPVEAFGFLVPPNQKVPILGVIFDSCVFRNKNSTVRIGTL